MDNKDQASELKPGEAVEGAPRQIWLPRKDAPYVPNANFYTTRDHDDDIEYTRADLTHPIPPPNGESLRGVIYQTVRNWIDDGHSYLNERIQQGDMGSLSEHIARAVARSVPRDWQPIASAPKDGTRILVGRGDYVWIDEWWKGDGSNSQWGELASWYQATGKLPQGPTRWMPLPAVPKGDE